MALSKKTFPKATAAAAAAFDPLQNFETVTYTGNGGTQKITGYIRKGAAFNGSSSVIDLNLRTTSGGYTIAFWMYADDGLDRYVVGDFNSSGSNNSSSIGIKLDDTSGTTQLRADIGDGTDVDSNDFGSFESYFGSWRHIAITVASNGTTVNMYVDGSPFGSTWTSARNMQNGINNLGFGTYGVGATTQMFDGKIDQVRIFNKELSSSEVTTLYGETYASSTKSTTDIFSDGSAVALYELDEDANDTGGSFGSLVTGSEIDLDVDGYTSGSVSDLSGNGNTATVTGATYGTDPNGGGYFELDGASDYLSIANSTDFNAATNFTIEGWFNPDNLTAADHLFAIYGGASDRKLFLRLNNTSGDLDWQIYNSSGSSAGAFTTSNANARLTANEWNHVAVTHINNGSMEVFVNGVSAGTGTSTGINTTGTEDLYIGVLNTFIGSYDFDGKVGDIRFYDSALTSSQIVQNFNASKGSYGGGYHGTPTNINFLGMAFQPDFVWIKNRDASYSHMLYDSIRGAGQDLSSDTSSAEGTVTGLMTSFDTNGFTVVAGGSNRTNFSGEDYVAWCWKAGGNSDIYNVDGTGYSTASDAGLSSANGTTLNGASVNTQAGFSIINYETNVNGDNRPAHGLTQEPELIILKPYDTSSLGWYVMTKKIDGSLDFLFLNTTDAKIDTANSEFINSTHFRTSFGTVWGSVIAYCFHSVDGYQKIGSYQGDGGSDNQIDLGFQPRFLMVKLTSHSGQNWYIMDDLRENTSVEKALSANTNGIEDSLSNHLDFTSTGFTLTKNSTAFNQSGYTYIYLAIA